MNPKIKKLAPLVYCNDCGALVLNGETYYQVIDTTEPSLRTTYCEACAGEVDFLTYLGNSGAEVLLARFRAHY